MITRPYILHALSPLHAGTGQGIGLIDLPTARERATEHPLVPGSSIKGVLRDATAKPHEAKVKELFGSTDGSAAMVRISDARVLAFPVKSDRGTFAWVTSRYVLLRFARDCADSAGFDASDVPAIAAGEAMTAETSAIVDDNQIVLAGLPFTRIPLSEGGQKVLAALASTVFPGNDDTNKVWRTFFSERIVIVSDDEFTWFTQTATDVRAHVRIGNSGTVERGALWYAETLPPETLLSGIIQVAAVRTGQDPQEAFDLLTQIVSCLLQVGGDATTGAGRARLVVGGGKA